MCLNLGSALVCWNCIVAVLAHASSSSTWYCSTIRPYGIYSKLSLKLTVRSLLARTTYSKLKTACMHNMTHDCTMTLARLGLSPFWVVGNNKLSSATTSIRCIDGFGSCLGKQSTKYQVPSAKHFSLRHQLPHMQMQMQKIT
jgi:hypothetical protein